MNKKPIVPKRFNGVNFVEMDGDTMWKTLNHLGKPNDDFPKALHEAHYTKNTVPFAKVVETLDLHGLDVVDIGLGGGAIAEMAFQNGASKVIAYEIQPERPETKEFINKCKKNGWKLELHTGDFRKEDLSYWENGRTAIVSNPPYALLPDIAKHMEKHQPVGSLLLMSAWRHEEAYQDPKHKIMARQPGWISHRLPTATITSLCPALTNAASSHPNFPPPMFSWT
ncbi:MAG: hypothetical protein K2Q01_10085 [Rickettsiales bacterium]|nr:hypothetical protein [Rickettsiales bacterium]